ncbi:MAG TPA: nickel pincer cofactor biosynthesis protein LarB [Planctomycetaceae bacterium]|nr:1-(5-phosphoribosyl)-5-amino-4-imidazole-carboxylate carboxylase [Blastopirellula sp.]HAY81331.1 nickel pincer cofactor biosynthesis protein LarB [Planctomycetaceae bacterium]|tara:strand:- start:96 stop:854 length:759 start_codon:yes stop_codon:yes gene_type:complete
MDINDLKLLAQRLATGQMKADEFVELVGEKTANLDNVSLDLDRRQRCGYPEVVFGEGKSTETLCAIFQRLLDAEMDVLATRVAADQVAALKQSFPTATYNAVARTLRINLSQTSTAARSGNVAVITAGTTDLNVAEEARETLDWMGIQATLIQDVGVAGPHRLPARLAEFRDSDAIVVVAGMEGALPSVVGGYVACPVVAVPTSVGYGANLGGVAALLSMLNSCAANVTVVNIDAGFKAGYVAGLIASRVGS